jgi:hypothetical protein
MNKKQTGDNALVQSKGTNMIYINSIRIIFEYTCMKILDTVDQNLNNPKGSRFLILRFYICLS